MGGRTRHQCASIALIVCILYIHKNKNTSCFSVLFPTPLVIVNDRHEIHRTTKFTRITTTATSNHSDQTAVARTILYKQHSSFPLPTNPAIDEPTDHAQARHYHHKPTNLTKKVNQNKPNQTKPINSYTYHSYPPLPVHHIKEHPPLSLSLTHAKLSGATTRDQACSPARRTHDSQSTRDSQEASSSPCVPSEAPPPLTIFFEQTSLTGSGREKHVPIMEGGGGRAGAKVLIFSCLSHLGGGSS